MLNLVVVLLAETFTMHASWATALRMRGTDTSLEDSLEDEALEAAALEDTGFFMDFVLAALNLQWCAML